MLYNLFISQFKADAATESHNHFPVISGSKPT